MGIPYPKMLQSGLFRIHTAVFLFGLAGLFGKFLSCSPLYMVLGRTFFAALALGLYALGFSGTRLTGFSARTLFMFSLQGALLAAHWYTFFLSIRISSVAVGLVTFSSFPLFVTFMEPLVFRERLKKRDIGLALAVFAGICLVIPDFDMGNRVTLGGFFGLLSGFTFALLALVNRKNARTADPVAVAFFQNAFAALCLAPVIALAGTRAPLMSDLPGLLFLGVACTALAHTLFISSLTHIRAQTASVIAGLEPVYGIVLAFFLLNEVPALRTLAGGAVIIATTVAAGLWESHQKAPEPSSKKASSL